MGNIGAACTITYAEAKERVGKAAQLLKLVCGVGNNAAWLVVLDGIDHARRCRRYRANVKGGRVSWMFKQAIQAYHDYERRLLHATENRMFHMADMPADIRRKYGDISDREFFEFWQAVGGPAYTKTRPLISSLWNKYRLSLVNHGIADAEHVAWVMTAQAAIDLALTMYEGAMREATRMTQLPRRTLDGVFSQFSLRRVSQLWQRAMIALAPETEPIKLSAVEERNIDLGLRQLMDAWMNPETLYQSTSDAVRDYDEVFATVGFQKMVLREIADVKNETIKNLEDEET